MVNLERQALKLAIQRPALCGPVFDALAAGDFTVPVHGAVRELIAGCGGVAGARSAREWAERLIEAAPNDQAREFVTRLAVEPVEAPGKDGEPDARYAEAVLAQVEDLTVTRQISTLKSRLQRLSPVEHQDYNRIVRRPGGAGAAAQGPAGPGIRDILTGPLALARCGRCAAAGAAGVRRSAVTAGLTWSGAVIGSAGSAVTYRKVTKLTLPVTRAGSAHWSA